MEVCVKRRLVVLGVVVGLVAGSLALPAEAKKKKKKKAKPVATTLYLEGTSNFGEEDQSANSTYLKLVTEPGSGEKSMGMPQYGPGPNPNCAGNSLVPVFVGPTSGRILGDMKVTFDAMASGGSVEVRVWPDMGAQACNEAYIEPAGAVEVALPSGTGTVEAVIEGLDFEAASIMMIQVTPVSPGYGRAFYGTDASKVEFECVPAKGSSCV